VYIVPCGPKYCLVLYNLNRYYFSGPLWYQWSFIHVDDLKDEAKLKQRAEFAIHLQQFAERVWNATYLPTPWNVCTADSSKKSHEMLKFLFFCLGWEIQTLDIEKYAIHNYSNEVEVVGYVNNDGSSRVLMAEYPKFRFVLPNMPLFTRLEPVIVVSIGLQERSECRKALLFTSKSMI